MRKYLDLLRKVIDDGVIRPDRTSTGNKSVFGEQLRFDLRRFPLVTTKEIHIKSVIHELLWFLSGDTHIYLNHFEQVELQLLREPYPLPTLRILRRPPSIFEYEFEDFAILDYKFHPAIRAPIAV